MAFREAGLAPADGSDLVLLEVDTDDFGPVQMRLSFDDIDGFGPGPSIRYFVGDKSLNPAGYFDVYKGQDSLTSERCDRDLPSTVGFLGRNVVRIRGTDLPLREVMASVDSLAHRPVSSLRRPGRRLR
jgi:hypothetical protein